jgi:DNA-binding NarL/FixJ family response regulator
VKDERIRLVVLDRMAATRDAVRIVCEGARDLELVGEGAVGAEPPALKEADVIVVGVDESVATADLNGIRSRFASSIVLLVDEDDARGNDLLRTGADAVVPKRAPVSRIVSTIRDVAGGGPRRHAPPGREPPGTRLSPRERQVLELLSQGRTNREIAGELGITPRTASTHIAAIYRKLGVSGRVDATRRALELRLIPQRARPHT